jgi:phage FluMu protein Com
LKKAGKTIQPVVMCGVALCGSGANINPVGAAPHNQYAEGKNMASINTQTTTSQIKKRCPRCKEMAVLTTLKYCKDCSNAYKTERRAKIRAQKALEETPKVTVTKQPEAPDFYCITDFAQNPLYQRWTR